jgi:microcystin-dependent protein
MPSANPFIGQIELFGGNFAIQGWAFCNGQLLNIADYDALFALIGTTYGGDGQNTFALPNLNSRMAVGVGTGPGLSTVTQGQSGGTESVTLVAANVPAHSHSLAAQSGRGDSISPGSTLVPAQVVENDGTPHAATPVLHPTPPCPAPVSAAWVAAKPWIPATLILD